MTISNARLSYIMLRLDFNSFHIYAVSFSYDDKTWNNGHVFQSHVKETRRRILHSFKAINGKGESKSLDVCVYMCVHVCVRSADAKVMFVNVSF